MEVGPAGVAGSGWPVSGEAVPVMQPDVVEEVLARLGRGEPVERLAQEHGIDRKTVRAWRVAARAVSATVRFETPPGQHAQGDFGQRRVWIGDA